MNKTSIEHLAKRYIEGASILSLAAASGHDRFTLQTQIHEYIAKLHPRRSTQTTRVIKSRKRQNNS